MIHCGMQEPMRVIALSALMLPLGSDSSRRSRTSTMTLAPLRSCSRCSNRASDPRPQIYFPRVHRRVVGRQGRRRQYEIQRTRPQHAIILQLADNLPCRLLGDPLQGIFGFNEPLIDWDRDVSPDFDELPPLTVPHRWGNNAALGRRLLELRAARSGDQS